MDGRFDTVNHVGSIDELTTGSLMAKVDENDRPTVARSSARNLLYTQESDVTGENTIVKNAGKLRDFTYAVHSRSINHYSVKHPGEVHDCNNKTFRHKQNSTVPILGKYEPHLCTSHTDSYFDHDLEIIKMDIHFLNNNGAIPENNVSIQNKQYTDLIMSTDNSEVNRDESLNISNNETVQQNINSNMYDENETESMNNDINDESNICDIDKEPLNFLSNELKQNKHDTMIYEHDSVIDEAITKKDLNLSNAEAIIEYSDMSEGNTPTSDTDASDRTILPSTNQYECSVMSESSSLMSQSSPLMSQCKILDKNQNTPLDTGGAVTMTMSNNEHDVIFDTSQPHLNNNMKPDEFARQVSLNMTDDGKGYINVKTLSADVNSHPTGDNGVTTPTMSSAALLNSSIMTKGTSLCCSTGSNDVKTLEKHKGTNNLCIDHIASTCESFRCQIADSSSDENLNNEASDQFSPMC
ncbi:unnamed protein product, partial [Owenia fusiformis]